MLIEYSARKLYSYDQAFHTAVAFTFWIIFSFGWNGEYEMDGWYWKFIWKLKTIKVIQQLLNLLDWYWGYINITVQKDMDMWNLGEWQTRDLHSQGLQQHNRISRYIPIHITTMEKISCFSKTVIIRALLARWNLMNLSQAVYPFREEESTEHVNHSFLLCLESWRIWQRFQNWFGIIWCMLKTMDQEVLQRSVMVKGKFQWRAFIMLSYVILWGYLECKKQVFFSFSFWE
jgi:hypothetical protein